MSQPRLLGGRYELESVIGRGGMAEVYRARDLRLDRVVAVKTLRPDLARDPIFQERFRREAQSAASLNHPSVIAVYDTGEDAVGDTPIPYIVMEYVDGSTLRDLLRENRALMPQKALEITDGILRALDYSHRGGIVHRDIKPANVMLTRQHEVKVMDFGIARAMSDAASTMTQTAQVIGTAQYLSPEQARGERVDARSDLYSTGCVLYELLTGRPPFTGDSPVAIAYQHVREEPTPPSQIDPDIPQWADAIVLKAMAKAAADRYQNAGEFRQEVQRALHGQPVTSTAASTMMLGAAPTAVHQPQQHTQVMGATQVQRQDGYDLPPVQYGDYRQDGDYDRGRHGDGGKGGGSKAAIWIGAAVAVLAVAALLGWLIAPPGGSDTVKVAAVANMSVDEATKALKDQGFTVAADPQKEYNKDVDKGKVIRSDPAEGTAAKKGSMVALVVSRGPEPPKKVDVPDVSGTAEADAKSTLEGRGFKVDIQRIASNEVQQGMAIRTDPKGGEQVAPNSSITLYISSGAQDVAVPNLQRLPKDVACQRLRRLKLTCVVQEQASPDPTIPPGVVWNVSPQPGTKLPSGSSVTVIVTPPQQATPPPDQTQGPPPQQ
ncbi:Stk1 family PASTA domain-containing Ser/Thr kinase [Actinomadura harenae]|uniref:non-specific serine/threonine protein kinase n=1 Tax=Actinomadura harenae TaxID=2483351 RepID=A0A3M2LVU4_9ACTN|nr:Stk1 family PASTA domain-containing Ser/Thr kinase [Actinomadura harenae]RMI41497.1 Stk1 family PASTA domain-containing Ser/Thr kinase [Actinomadura harenae]